MKRSVTVKQGMVAPPGVFLAPAPEQSKESSIGVSADGKRNMKIMRKSSKQA